MRAEAEELDVVKVAVVGADVVTRSPLARVATRSPAAVGARQWCAYHLKVEGCTKGDTCKFPHLDVSAVNAIKKAQLAQRG